MSLIISPYRFSLAPVPVSDDPYWGNVVSLIHFDGADASTTFTDQKGKSWTATGNAQLDTAQFKFGTASLLLDGTTDKIQTASSSDFDFGTGAFTIECWVRPAVLYFGAFISRRTFSANGWVLGMFDDGSVALRAKIGAAYSDTYLRSAAGVLTAGVWSHVALTRTGSDWYLFVDGVVVDTLTNAGALHDQAESVRIGVANNASEWDYNGHIDEVRITKGVARYTAAFTPPSAPFPNS